MAFLVTAASMSVVPRHVGVSLLSGGLSSYSKEHDWPPALSHSLLRAVVQELSKVNYLAGFGV